MHHLVVDSLLCDIHGGRDLRVYGADAAGMQGDGFTCTYYSIGKAKIHDYSNLKHNIHVADHPRRTPIVHQSGITVSLHMPDKKTE